MGIKEDAMWAMARKMGMPESAIEAVKVKGKGNYKMPDMNKIMEMKAVSAKNNISAESIPEDMLKMARKMGMPQKANMDGMEIIGRLKRLSTIGSIKDVPQLTKALFPGTHCPLMGAAMIAGGIKDCLLVIVGTDECSYYTKSLTISPTFGGLDGRCVSVVLDSHDVTFGSTEKMHKAYQEIIAEYKPGCVMLVTTCVIEVIGDDYDAIAKELWKEYGVPVMAVHTEHFKCEDHFPGFERAITACAQLMVPQEANGSVNVLGQRVGNFSDTELYKVLQKAGVKIGVQLPSGCTTADIRQAAAAKLNIVVHDIALPLAQEMEQRFGIPYVFFNKFTNPENIMSAYKKLFACLGVPLPAQLEEKYAGCKIMEQQSKEKLSGITYVYGNTPYDCFEVNAYLCQLGMVPQIIQSNRYGEQAVADATTILQHTDPYMCKAANIAPLQYVYDVLHPYIYMGHEFAERLRAKGMSILHSDAAGAMLGFEVNSFLLQGLIHAADEAKTYRRELGL